MITRAGYLSLGIKDHYIKYKKSESYELLIDDYKLYKEVISFIFGRIWFYMFSERWIFTAPNNFGQFYVKESLESKKGHKDWKKSKEQGKLVRSFNYHTNGRTFYMYWCKTLTRMDNKNKYKFKAFRGEPDKCTGQIGLNAWIRKCAADPFLPDFRGHLI